MKLKPSVIAIPENNPFEHDLLGREESAQALTNLIRSTDDPLVLCINAAWGEGKTTFLSMWRQMLKNENFKTLYFNAWENDFSTDATVALIAELELGIKELEVVQEQETVVRQCFDQVKSMGVGLIKKSAPMLIRAATAGLLDLKDLEVEAIADLGEKLAEEQIKAYEQAKNSVTGFKTALSEFASQVTPAKGEMGQLPLIVLIDELDRCRPTYAVDVLETVKHFFSVDNVVFVLALDREQLAHSIKTMYGLGMNASAYLRRFIDIEYNLPKPKKGEFCKQQFQLFGLNEAFIQRRNYGENGYDRGNLEESFTALFDAFQLSLRDQERCFTLLSLALRLTRPDHQLHPILLATLIALKVKDNNIYTEFSSRSVGHEKIVEFISQTKRGSEFINSRMGATLVALLLTAEASNDYRITADELAAPYEAIFKDMAQDQSKRDYAQRVMSVLHSIDRWTGRDMLRYLLNKIDLAANFD